MAKRSTDHVRALYDAYPWPSPVAGEGLIGDVANMVKFLFPSSSFSGKSILDAGCGSGHRLLGFAKRFPNASFLGIDLAAAPLSVARELAEKHGIGNVRFEQADLLAWRAQERFDLVVSTGVIHHLEDPRSGLANLCECLAHGGSLILWLYHPYGEFNRLLQRELVLTLWDRDSMSFAEGIGLLRELDISLPVETYSGAYAKRDSGAIDGTSTNVDGFLHPIVNAYRFGDALDLLAGCGMAWGAIHSISLGRNTKLLDLGRVSASGVAAFCLKHEALLAAESMRERYLRLDNRGKLKTIELLTKPAGFSIVAGRKDSRGNLDARMRGNLVDLNAP